MSTIAAQAVERIYPGRHVGIAGIDLEVADGELLVLVGPSGCGKSTLLRLIAGLDSPTAGRILIDGIDVTAVPPQQRDLAMVFQSYALYPHMTVYDNLAYSLRVRRSDRATIETRVAAAAEALDLEPLLGRRPAQLSGGQRQRVALGRALVREPKAFLLDEPLSNLDPSLRTQARAEILRLQRKLSATMIYVTHDQEEALTLGHRVAVMRDGRLEQLATPADLYDRPANAFVARFIGSPPMNLLPAAALGIAAPPDSIVGIRPHDALLGEEGVRATVDVIEPRGHDTVVHLRLDATGSPEFVMTVRERAPAPGSPALVSWNPQKLHLFDAVGKRRSG
ncbi:MAG TPA: ABC transporter ATP-binding protein [Vicinamibacterales bacterium]